MVEQVLKMLCEGTNLEARLSEEVARKIIDGEVSPIKMTAFLVGLKMKGETSEEIFGFVKVLREKSIKVESNGDEAIDLCGTGGDGKGTFNISTISAFVVAGAGVKVAKHGNRAISGNCGSTDLIEGLGIKVPERPELVSKSLNEIGLGFMHAPYFHPALKNIQPIRREIGVRTVFNLLGPLINPAGVKKQLIGVFGHQPMKSMAEAISRLGGQRYLLVHSQDGLDEISISAPTAAILVEKGEIMEQEIVPEDYGFKRNYVPVGANSVQDNVKILFSVLNGERSVYRDFVLVNAGAAIFVSGKAGDIREGIEMAREAIDSKRAFKVLLAFMKLHQED
ncbi:MAG: anthranilate phosphoribosyltransferase [Candidatus Saccharicenans sp.]